MKKTISLLHPFSGIAVGVPEEGIPSFHSQPHVKAMEKLSADGYQCSIEYFSDRFFPYKIKKDLLQWKFYPVSKRRNDDHKKWKKQWSDWAILWYWFSIPDLTIINMSGHSSPFSMYLGKLIRSRGKKYIAMLGGQALTLDKPRMEYYKNAEHLLVHTVEQKEEIEAIKEFAGCDVRSFPLGVNCDLYIPKIKPNTVNFPTLLFVGRVAELKRIHLAIDALEHLKQNGFAKAELQIVGPTSSSEYYQRLKHMVIEKGLTDAVFFEGFVEYDKLISYYQGADLLLLPSEHESFGMVMVESMACGTPVAAIDCPGGPREAVRNGVNGILCSVEEYSKEILRAVKNSCAMRVMSKAARETVLSNYSIEKTYRILKRSVEDCLSS